MDDQRSAVAGGRAELVNGGNESADVAGAVLVAADHRAGHRVGDDERRRFGHGGDTELGAGDAGVVEHVHDVGQEADPVWLGDVARLAPGVDALGETQLSLRLRCRGPSRRGCRVPSTTVGR